MYTDAVGRSIANRPPDTAAGDVRMARHWNGAGPAASAPSPSESTPASESPDYLSRQLITYIGNKRALLGQIGAAVQQVKRRLGQDRLRILDAFSGSGVVSRLMKAHASLLVSNDLEDYAAVINRCYLRNRSTVDLAYIARIVDELNERVERAAFPKGFIEEMYAPRDEANIRDWQRAADGRSSVLGQQR